MVDQLQEENKDGQEQFNVKLNEIKSSYEDEINQLNQEIERLQEQVNSKNSSIELLTQEHDQSQISHSKQIQALNSEIQQL